jgi:hypothetical protein
MTDIAARLSAGWRWIAHTEAGLGVRIGVGVLVFAYLAVADVCRRGSQATRWREYLFLLTAVCVALLYGVVNDQITSRISWEYFYYGKDLAPILGDRTPPDQAKLSREAAKVGLKATWTVGLLVGVAILLANNPKPGRPQLSYGKLLKRMPMIVFSTFICAALLGAVGSVGGFASLSEDFRDMVHRDLFRPYRFMAVYGIHVGGYVGGFVGMLWAIVSIRRERRAVCPLDANP